MRRESHPRRFLGRSRFRIGFLVYAGPHPWRSAVDMLHNPLPRVDLLSKQSRRACPVDMLHEVAPEAGLAPAPHRLTGERRCSHTTLDCKLAEGMGDCAHDGFEAAPWLPTRALVYADPPPKYLADKVSDRGASSQAATQNRSACRKLAEG